MQHIDLVRIIPACSTLVLMYSWVSSYVAHIALFIFRQITEKCYWPTSEPAYFFHCVIIDALLLSLCIASCSMHVPFVWSYSWCVLVKTSNIPLKKIYFHIRNSDFCQTVDIWESDLFQSCIGGRNDNHKGRSNLMWVSFSVGIVFKVTAP